MDTTVLTSKKLSRVHQCLVGLILFLESLSPVSRIQSKFKENPSSSFSQMHFSLESLTLKVVPGELLHLGEQRDR